MARPVLRVALLATFLLLATGAPGGSLAPALGQAQLPGPLRSPPRPPLPIRLPVIPACIRSDEVRIGRVPVEPGKAAYIWPDDRGTDGHHRLHHITSMKMEPGDTLYLREGTHEEWIETQGPTRMAPAGGGD